MNWTIIGVIIAALGVILAIVTGITKDIDKKMERQINNPAFIKKVAEQVRLPFIIFDENERFLHDSGGTKYVESIKITRKENKVEDIDEIIVVCKEFLDSAPILQSIDGTIQFHDAERADQKSWKFKAFHASALLLESSETKPPERFKLEFIP